MASLASSVCPTFSSPLPKPSQLFVNAKRNQRFQVSCKANGGDGTSGPKPQSVDNSIGKLDRRNMLVGLGGLYGVANMVGDRLAFAGTDGSGEAVPYPDITKCGPAYIVYDPANPENNVKVGYSCCPPRPPAGQEIKKYQVPKNQPTRIRPAAHLVDDTYIKKYTDAIQAMKDLSIKDPSDPRGFEQQANIHCAYCNYGYPTGVKDDNGNEILLQVHNSWLFLPFHRWYLYFFEKIAGELIGDPTFGLPYWNWDAPCGMTMPYMFVPEKGPVDTSKDNPLYDANRDQTHLPPAVLDFARSPAGTPDIQIVCNNLAVMYRQMVTNARKPEDFMGGEYYHGSVLDNQNPLTGSLESSPHSPVHGWTGRPRNSTTNPPSYGEDMGNFYSAGRDTLFYCHHANVDRMWTVWRRLGGHNFKNKAWLDSEFFFYDEKKNPVYVTVADCLKEEELGYTYQPMELPWLKAKPMPGLAKKDVAKKSNAPSVANALPAKLDKVVKVLVQRPKKSRTKQQKEKKQEILVIEGIEWPSNEDLAFDIFINDEDEKGDVLSKAEFAGSFATVPHGGADHQLKSNLTIGLDEILEDLQCEDDEHILVTLIPKSAGDKATIDHIKIDFS